MRNPFKPFEFPETQIPLTEEEKAKMVLKQTAKVALLVAAVPAAIFIAKKIYDRVNSEDQTETA